MAKRKDDSGDGQIDPELLKELEQEAAAASYLGYALEEEEEEASDEETLDGEAIEADYRAALGEEHTTGSFARKFLLAIIRANEPDPEVTDTDVERLRKAAEALFGSKKIAHSISRRRNDDHLALEAMAWWYIEDRALIFTSPGPGEPLQRVRINSQRPRTKKELAKLAKRKYPNTTSERTLENKFGKRTRELCRTVKSASDILGSFHLQALKQLKPLIEPLGIKMNIDD